MHWHVPVLRVLLPRIQSNKQKLIYTTSSSDGKRMKGSGRARGVGERH